MVSSPLKHIIFVSILLFGASLIHDVQGKPMADDEYGYEDHHNETALNTDDKGDIAVDEYDGTSEDEEDLPDFPVTFQSLAEKDITQANENLSKLLGIGFDLGLDNDKAYEIEMRIMNMSEKQKKDFLELVKALADIIFDLSFEFVKDFVSDLIQRNSQLAWGRAAYNAHHSMGYTKPMMSPHLRVHHRHYPYPTNARMNTMEY